jgi:hypothetical protein
MLQWGSRSLIYRGHFHLGRGLRLCRSSERANERGGEGLQHCDFLGHIASEILSGMILARNKRCHPAAF